MGLLGFARNLPKVSGNDNSKGSKKERGENNIIY